MDQVVLEKKLLSGIYVDLLRTNPAGEQKHLDYINRVKKPIELTKVEL